MLVWSVFHLPKFLLLSLVFAYIYISQGSVETHLSCGGICNNHIIANCLQSAPVKECWKSVNNRQRYRQKKRCHIFMAHGIYKLTHGDVTAELCHSYHTWAVELSLTENIASDLLTVACLECICASHIFVTVNARPQKFLCFWLQFGEKVGMREIIRFHF